MSKLNFLRAKINFYLNESKDKKGKIIKIWDNVKVKDHAKEVLETVKNLS